MTKKRFISIIMTVLMVLSIVPTTSVYAATYGDEPCVGVARKTTPIYSDITNDIKIGTIEVGQGFTILDEKANGLMRYYYINYNNSADPNGYNSYGYVRTNSDIKTLGGSTATVKWNESVYYGPSDKYQRCGTLYAGETIAVLERGENYCYVEYNDNVHGRRKRAYVRTNAITLNNIKMKEWELLPIEREAEMHVKCYIGSYFTVYSGPSTQYEPVGSVSDMHIYWVKRVNGNYHDHLFKEMMYIRYQVTGTNTWKSGYIAYPYNSVVEDTDCSLHG